MCAIAGIVRLSTRPVPKDRIKAMCDIMSHRGPDDAGYAYFKLGTKGSKTRGIQHSFTDLAFRHLNEHLPPYGGEYCRGELAHHDFDLVLGHRRLSILDLSHKGHEPMSNSDQRLWMTYNGEVYNFPEIKSKLVAKGHEFRSRTDTEVILQSWEDKGSESLPELNGMFAFAIFDRSQGTLTLVRDRFGVKPLYYSVTKDFLIFASEVKGILASGLIAPRLDPSTVVEYMTFQNIYRPMTLFKNIRLLPPGHLIRIKAGSEGSVSDPKAYADTFPSVPSIKENPKQCAERVADLFEKAVRRQLISDVPVGAYLSGGMDSGSIVAVAGTQIPRLMTFTGGFDMTNVNGLEQGFDERRLAEKLSYLLQTEHYDVVLHSGDMPAAMEKLTWHLDDPRCGMCHPNWYTAKLASRFVKVCLSGAGGDELFGGYPWRYRLLIDAKDPAEFEERSFRYWNRLLPPEDLPALFSRELQKLSPQTRDIFGDMLKGAPPWDPDLDAPSNFLRRALYVDYTTFLHGLLIVDDRLSNAHSMETRVPFLDNDLGEYALAVPPSLKVDMKEMLKRRNETHMKTAEGKKILRQAMERYLPKEYTLQHKQGFSPPDENWFRGPSMDYIKEILFDQKTLDRPWFDQKFVKKRLDEHFSGKKNHRMLIWSLLSLEWLQRHFVDESAAK